MRFIVDAQLPPQLASWIAQHGHDAAHVTDVLDIAATDQEDWRLALDDGAVIVSKDRDFSEWAASRRPAPQVVWIRLGNLSTAELIARTARAWDGIVAGLHSGAATVEVGAP